MADFSPLAKVTEVFASGQTAVDAILRRYGTPTTLTNGNRAKGDFDATPVTLYADMRADQTQQSGGGADQTSTRTFYTRAEVRGPDDIAVQQGDEIVVVETRDIYQVERLEPWRKGLGDVVICTRTGRVGDAPYN